MRENISQTSNLPFSKKIYVALPILIKKRYKPCMNRINRTVGDVGKAHHFLYIRSVGKNTGLARNAKQN